MGAEDPKLRRTGSAALCREMVEFMSGLGLLDQPIADHIVFGEAFGETGVGGEDEQAGGSEEG